MASLVTLGEAEAWRLCGPMPLTTELTCLHTVTNPLVITSMTVINWNTGGSPTRFVIYLVPATAIWAGGLPPKSAGVISKVLAVDTVYLCEELLMQPLMPGEGLWAIAEENNALNIMATAIYIVR